MKSNPLLGWCRAAVLPVLLPILVSAPLIGQGSVTPLTGVAPLTVNLSGVAFGVNSGSYVYWGDGTSSLPLGPMTPHTYTTPGQYFVFWSWHSGFNGFGTYTTISSGSGAATVTVLPPVGASFTATPTSGTAPLNVQFSNTSTGQPTSWSWNFGDGTSSTAQNPSHVYAAPGNYTVALTASKAGVPSNTMTRYGYISVGAPPLTISNITVCGTGSACPGPTACVLPTGISADICINGTGFTASSVVRANGVSLPTTFNGATQLGVTISLAASSPNFLRAGNYTITVQQSGNTSNGVALTVQNPMPSISGIAPSSLNLGVLAGSSPGTFTLSGGIFASDATILVNGTGVPSTTLDLFTIQASLPAQLLSVPGTAVLRVSNPGPGGGTSTSSVNLNVLGPQITGVFGSAIPIPVAPASSGSVFVQGSNFSPSAVVHVDGVAQSTINIDANTVRFTLNPALPQLQQRGAVVLNVVNPGPIDVVSNSFPVVIGGSGSNKGTIRRNPVAPALGQQLGILLENGTPNQLFTLIVDGANPAAIYPFATPVANQVLNVRPGAIGPGLWLTLADGLGLFGPPTGSAFGPNGVIIPFVYALPNPPLGVTVTVQGVYLDPTAPQGYYLTWARRESL